MEGLIDVTLIKLVIDFPPPLKFNSIQVVDEITGILKQ